MKNKILVSDCEIFTALNKMKAKHHLLDIHVAYALDTTPSYFSHMYNDGRALSYNMREKILCLIDILKRTQELKLYRLVSESHDEFRQRKNESLDALKTAFYKEYNKIIDIP